MKNKFKKQIFFFITFPIIFFSVNSLKAFNSSDQHVWEMKEIKLTSEKKYNNYYTDVAVWVELKGPDFSKRIYGFWDGSNNFIVRIVATKPGRWSWTSGSNQTDEGLNNHTESFTAVEWTEKEKEQNPNRHGFVRPT